MKQSEQYQPVLMLIMMMMFIGSMFIAFDPVLRTKIGMLMNTVFDPLIGFDGKLPILTLFLGAIVLGIFTSFVRHIFVDWIELARIQFRIKSFSKEMRNAAVTQNTYKLKKLQSMQPEIAKMQMPLQYSQMKPMMFIMFVAIPMFLWLSVFIGTLEEKYIEIVLPGNATTTLHSLGPLFNLFPVWMILYSLFSFPFNRLFEKLLKTIRFRKKMISQ